MSRFVLSLLLALPAVFASACTSSEQTCAAAGDCPAGAVCTAGICEAVMTPVPDAAARVDTGTGVYDAGPVVDSGPVRPPIDANIVFRDMGFNMDAAPSVPVGDAGGGGVDPQDIGPPLFDVPIVNVLTLGDPCTVPDFEQGEIDQCGIDDPNYYCIASLDGQGGYCTQACSISDHEEEEGDAGNVYNNCGNGCCVPVRDGEDAGMPGELIDGVCRFAPDCN